jgi:hypothetical protein
MKIRNKSIGMAALALASTGIFAFTNFAGGSIKGTVTPAENAVSVWAIKGTDTLKSAIVGGNFELSNAVAGTYVVTVVAAAPYKSVVKESVVVSDDQVVDLGNIILEK